MSIAVIAVVGLVLLVSWVCYYVFSWLRVDPIQVGLNATESDRVASVHRWLDQQFEQSKFNGGVLVLRDGKILLCKTCGYTDHTATAQLDRHSAFRLASVSKQFTAAGALRLTDMGLLDLDDPLPKHLEGFPAENVTVRHLLNQTSGIPDEYMLLARKHRKAIGGVLTISKVVELASQRSSGYRAPGETMEYSNTNYVLLAGVLEAASGKSYEQFMLEELFQPLGMKDTRVWNLLSDNRSPNQTGDFDQIHHERTPVEASWLDGVAGDGAVFCSLNDFVIWDRFWYGNPLVSDGLLQEAFQCPTLSAGGISHYGFGWVLEQKRQWHNGAWLGANTYIARYPASRSCLVVLDNSSNLRLGNMANKIEDALAPVFHGE